MRCASTFYFFIRILILRVGQGHGRPISVPNSENEVSRECVCAFVSACARARVRVSLYVEAKPIDPSRSNSIFGILFKISVEFKNFIQLFP